MYFVTIKQAGYALFSTTPSERAAIGLTEDQQRVRLLAQDGPGWRVVQEWPVAERSHTDLMIRFGDVPEPDSVDDLLRLATGA
ncbi:MAG TPA: hypothetical protein VGR62_17865 [Candidatus Binatia bacterium]|nr:hypothetical protein [Candidatus Binatia bacterium]